MSAEQDAGVGAVGAVDQAATTNKGVTPSKATDKGVLPAAPPASDAHHQQRQQREHPREEHRAGVSRSSSSSLSGCTGRYIVNLVVL